MKSFSIQQHHWAKSIFAIFRDYLVDRKSRFAKVESASHTITKEKLNNNHLQRMAHMGNFFAGPHAIINPALLK